MEVKKRNNLIDALKCLACLAVVFLHFPTEEYGRRFVFLQTAIGRCGVPLFFMISGYFFSLKSKEKQQQGFLLGALRMAIYYVIYEVLLYFIDVLVQLLMGREKIFNDIELGGKNIIKFLLCNEPFYADHLWYILAYMYCLLIFYFAIKFRHGTKVIAVLTPFLLAGYHLLGRYSQIFLNRSFDECFARNYFFAAIPMFAIGYFLNRIKAPSKTEGGMIVFIIVAFLCLHFESMSFFRTSFIDGGRNNYLFNLILAFLIIKLVTTTDKNISTDNPLAVIGRKYSLYIYLFQYAVSRILKVFIYYTEDYYFGRFFKNLYGFSKPLMIFFFSLLLAIAAYSVERKITKRK